MDGICLILVYEFILKNCFKEFSKTKFFTDFMQILKGKYQLFTISIASKI